MGLGILMRTPNSLVVCPEFRKKNWIQAWIKINFSSDTLVCGNSRIDHPLFEDKSKPFRKSSWSTSFHSTKEAIAEKVLAG